MKKSVVVLLRTFVFAVFVPVLSFCFVSCNPDSGGIIDGGDPGDSPIVNYATEEGLYVGIIGFNSDLVSKDISILNNYTKNSYTYFIDNLNSSNGTALYYSVDRAIDNFSKAIMPKELENVSIVTFTDGLDNFSTIMPDIEGFNYTKKEYLSKVNEKLTTTTVREKILTAYSIGILGEDVKDEDEFKDNLESLSTSEENIYQVQNMNDVNSAFEQIARSLNTKSVSRSITLKISGGIDNGSRIKFTLEDVADASSSQFYIEGDIYRAEKTFRNVSCKGISIDEDNIQVSIANGFIVLSFNIVDTDYEINATNITYWTRNSKDEWQKDSEFDPESQAETSIIRKSAAIMLVLDCSSSLGDDFEQLKKTAKEFIDILVSGESENSGGNNNGGAPNDSDFYPEGMIDLGLSVYWSSCNIGASKPWETGGSYAWGSLRDIADSDTYEYPDTYLKDDDSFGDSFFYSWYDVAYVTSEGSCRIPTYVEMLELYYNCTWVSTTLNGNSGFKVIGPNGNYIFMCDGKYWTNTAQYQGAMVGRVPMFLDCKEHTYGSGVETEGLYVRPVSDVD